MTISISAVSIMSLIASFCSGKLLKILFDIEGVNKKLFGAAGQVSFDVLSCGIKFMQ